MSEDDRVWVIDTSSILEVRRKVEQSKQASAYGFLSELSQSGKVIFPKEVLDELVRGGKNIQNDPPLKWATLCANASVKPNNYLVIRDVLAVASAVLDASKVTGEDEADPYVIAMALELKRSGHEVTVITEDRKDTPNKMSMSTACGLLGVPSVPVMPLLYALGWK